VLLTAVAAALDAINPLEPSVLRAVAAARSSIWSTAMPRLGRALASTQRPLLLVLDDIHELEDRDCLDAVVALAGNVPSGSQLVLAGRSDRLPTPRLRASGRLLEIGVGELALNEPEALALLSEAGVELATQETKTLIDRIEGWPAGLYLAALSLRQNAHRRPAMFDGDDRFVTDYLRSEHLASLSRKEMQFLTRTSVLERMTGPLCDAVLQRSDGTRTLESLERRNLFVIALDRQRRWFRYHHLFRDMLRSELAAREPDSVDQLHRRAAAWFEEAAMPEDAIEHATAAGDLDEVARLVCSEAVAVYRAGRTATVERWLKLFDEPHLLERYPAVAATGTWVWHGRAGPDERWARAVEHSTYSGTMPDGSSLRPWVALARMLRSRGGANGMRRDAGLALRELSPSSPWRGIAAIYLASAVMLLGDAEAADRLFVEAADVLTADAGTNALAIALAQRALLALARDDLGLAELLIADSRARADESPTEQWHAEAAIHTATAKLALRRGDRALAREELSAVQRLRPEFGHGPAWFAAQFRLELADVCLALSDVAGARALYREVKDDLSEEPGFDVLTRRAERLRERLDAASDQSSGWASALTAAELRLLPLLTTHLSFKEIADRLFVSRNTVKTQAISVYRKLDASSRSQAIARAMELGLVEDTATQRDFTPMG
jgi:LuxR family maltose regulon positive regulatory protein